MIIVRKLNTKTFTGRDLVERLYSEGWELEQREYGLVKKRYSEKLLDLS